MNTKIVAQLDSTGKFINTTIIQESPKEPGVWLYPQYTTDILPDPTIDLNEYDAIFNSTDGVYNYVEITPLTEKLRLLKMQKIDELIQIVDDIINTYTYDYSHTEKLSWPKQEAEALQLLNDPNAEAPFLRSLANHRGYDLIVLRDKILFNVENYIFLSSLLIGHQQKYIDQINSYTVDDIEELKTLQFTFPL